MYPMYPFLFGFFQYTDGVYVYTYTALNPYYYYF
jgi:hypothetical protein